MSIKTKVLLAVEDRFEKEEFKKEEFEKEKFEKRN